MDPLHVDNAVKSGWFQWIDMIKKIIYPECHVLIFKEDDFFIAWNLDFGFIATADTIDEAFSSIQEVAIINFDSSDFDIEISRDVNIAPEYWNKFRDLHIPRKIEHFKETPSRGGEFIFDMYDAIKELKKQNEELKELLKSERQEKGDLEKSNAKLLSMLQRISRDRIVEAYLG
jgi:hypothetical protein